MVRLKQITINNHPRIKSYGKRVCNVCRTDNRRTIALLNSRTRYHVMGYRRICRHHVQRLAGAPHQGERTPAHRVRHCGTPLNGSDYYEVYLQKDKAMECINGEVCFDELGDVIDRAIEKGTDQAEYDRFCDRQRDLLFSGQHD